MLGASFLDHRLLIWQRLLLRQPVLVRCKNRASNAPGVSAERCNALRHRASHRVTVCARPIRDQPEGSFLVKQKVSHSSAMRTRPAWALCTACSTRHVHGTRRDGETRHRLHDRLQMHASQAAKPVLEHAFFGRCQSLFNRQNANLIVHRSPAQSVQLPPNQS